MKNRHKYSIKSICDILNISRSSVYYQSIKQNDSTLDELIRTIWKDSKESYGARNIKLDLLDLHGLRISRRRIRRIMKQIGIQSLYNTTKSFKPPIMGVNNARIQNYFKQDFVVGLPKIAIVSDLTYVRVNNNWNYVCLMID